MEDVVLLVLLIVIVLRLLLLIFLLLFFFFFCFFFFSSFSSFFSSSSSWLFLQFFFFILFLFVMLSSGFSVFSCCFSFFSFCFLSLVKVGRMLPRFLAKSASSGHFRYRSIQIDYRQTLFWRGVHFHLQIQNRAARRINFHHRDRSLGISADNHSVQILLLSLIPTFQ